MGTNDTERESPQAEGQAEGKEGANGKGGTSTIPPYSPDVNLGCRTATEIREHPLAKPAVLIEGFAFLGDLMIITGPYDALKSRFAAEIARAVLTGDPLLGRFAVKSPGPVILIQEDMAEAVFDDTRVVPLVRGLPNEVTDHLHVWSRSGFRLEGKWLRKLEALIESTHARLVIIDPLGECFPTSSGVYVFNPNLDTCVSDMLRPLRAMRERYGVTFILVHHDPKPGESHERHARGSSVLVNLPDVRFFLKGVGSVDGLTSSRVRTSTRNWRTPFPFTIECREDGRLMWGETKPESSAELEITVRAVASLTASLGRLPNTMEVAGAMSTSKETARKRLYRATEKGALVKGPEKTPTWAVSAVTK